MATTYKILGQVAPATTNNTDLYTVPAATQTIVSTLAITNLTDVEQLYQIYIRNNGAATSATNAFAYNTKILGSVTTTVTIGITLDAGDIITVKSPVADTITYMAFGAELS
jgi:hypothetical protein